jgi:hypothetical protein
MPLAGPRKAVAVGASARRLCRRCLAWIGTVSSSQLLFHGCGSGTDSDRAPPGACSSSGATASCTSTEAPARSRQATVQRRLDRLQRRRQRPARRRPSSQRGLLGRRAPGIPPNGWVRVGPPRLGRQTSAARGSRARCRRRSAGCGPVAPTGQRRDRHRQRVPVAGSPVPCRRSGAHDPSRRGGRSATAPGSGRSLYDNRTSRASHPAARPRRIRPLWAARPWRRGWATAPPAALSRAWPPR